MVQPLQRWEPRRREGYTGTATDPRLRIVLRIPADGMLGTGYIDKSRLELLQHDSRHEVRHQGSAGRRRSRDRARRSDGDPGGRPVRRTAYRQKFPYDGNRHPNHQGRQDLENLPYGELAEGAGPT